MSGFDERCPHCDAKIDCQSAWQNSDHQDCFKHVCGECDKTLEITVHSVPEFRTERVRCLMCNKTSDSPRDYCDECKAKLVAIEREHAKRKEPPK